MRKNLIGLALLPLPLLSLAACGPKSEPQSSTEAPASPPSAAPAPAPAPAPEAGPAPVEPPAAAPAPVPPPAVTKAPAAKPAPAPAAAPAATKPSAAPAVPVVAAADLENGKRQFAICRACHTVVEGGASLTGPNLHGVFGRKAGSKPGYAYSEALASAGFTWTAERMDGWLASPKTYLPGNKMTFVGIKDAKNRADLIAFLQAETR